LRSFSLMETEQLLVTLRDGPPKRAKAVADCVVMLFRVELGLVFFPLVADVSNSLIKRVGFGLDGFTHVLVPSVCALGSAASAVGGLRTELVHEFIDGSTGAGDVATDAQKEIGCRWLARRAGIISVRLRGLIVRIVRLLIVVINGTAVGLAAPSVKPMPRRNTDN
jgi:hypothetical protein